MPQTISAASAALITALKGIKGSTSGHNTNLGGRVHTRLILPDELGAAGGDKPYLCLPKLDDAPVYSWEDRHVEIRWDQPVFGFIPETSSKTTEASSATLVDKLHEDIIEVILNDRTLGGAVKECHITEGGGGLGGADPEDKWGELLVVVRMLIIHSSGSLT